MEFQNFFAFVKKIDTVYQRFCQNIIKEWDLNPTSFQVILFLANNPDYNTARDVCRMRGIKTGIVSVAVEQLIQMGYLERRTDPNDRRIQRLYVTGSAQELVRRGREVQQEFAREVSGALTPEEFERYMSLTEKIMVHIDDMEQNL